MANWKLSPASDILYTARYRRKRKLPFSIDAGCHDIIRAGLHEPYKKQIDVTG